MLKYVTWGLVLGVMASTALGQARRTFGEPRLTPQAQVPATLRLLNQRIPEVAFMEAEFERVMEWVQDLTQVNVVVRWQKLEENGIQRDKPITINVKNVRLSQVLWMIMSEAGGTDVKLAYRATSNIIVMSTEEDLGQEMILRVYDVSDLIFRVPKFIGPQLDPSQALSQLGQGGQGGGGTTLFQQERQETRDTAGRTGAGGVDIGMTELIDLITEVIEPMSWQRNGGFGSIQPFGNHIIVRNNLMVHQQIAGYVREEE